MKNNEFMYNQTWAVLQNQMALYTTPKARHTKLVNKNAKIGRKLLTICF